MSILALIVTLALGPTEDTPAGRQLASWLTAFNSADRVALVAYHDRYFPYSATSRDVADIDRELALSRGTGGFDVQKIEQLTATRLMAYLKERRRPQFARVSLEVDTKPPHRVLRFEIGPSPTPDDLLTAKERALANVDAAKRRRLIDGIAREIEAHYVYPEVGERMIAAIREQATKGHYDAITFAPDDAQVRQAVGGYMSQVADADALVLDLRQNGGGDPDTVALVASYLFDDKPVHIHDLFRRDTGETEQFWTLAKVAGKRFGAKKPIYVLTSNRTFSAGEALTYDLQSLHRAVIVGETTGGGAHPTYPYPLGDGFAIAVPSGRVINPVTKTDWEGTGVIPDVKVPAPDALTEAHRLALTELKRRREGGAAQK